jgi:hypothetical protein
MASDDGTGQAARAGVGVDDWQIHFAPGRALRMGKGDHYLMFKTIVDKENCIAC